MLWDYRLLNRNLIIVGRDEVVYIDMEKWGSFRIRYVYPAPISGIDASYMIIYRCYSIYSNSVSKAVLIFRFKLGYVESLSVT